MLFFNIDCPLKNITSYFLLKEIPSIINKVCTILQLNISIKLLKAINKVCICNYKFILNSQLREECRFIKVNIMVVTLNKIRVSNRLIKKRTNRKQ